MTNVFPFPVRRTFDVCTNPACGKPIQPGQLYAVNADGPRHFGCCDKRSQSVGLTAHASVAPLRRPEGRAGRGASLSIVRPAAFPPSGGADTSSGPEAA